MSKNNRNRQAAANRAETAAREAARRKRVIWTNIGLVGAFVVILVGAILFLRPPSPQASGDGDAGTGGTTAPVVRADSHMIGEPGDSGVTLVEFLDFECEACGAFHPIVEELREKYAGQVSFYTRYFPIAGHQNAQNAAVAAEAAAQQGEFEAMHDALFESQGEWGELSESRAPLFRQFAEELGLDMTAFDAAVADPATLDRVLSDQTDGVELGVQSTPTFFIDGEKVELQSFDDLERALEAALAD